MKLSNTERYCLGIITGLIAAIIMAALCFGCRTTDPPKPKRTREETLRYLGQTLDSRRLDADSLARVKAFMDGEPTTRESK